MGKTGYVSPSFNIRRSWLWSTSLLVVLSVPISSVDAGYFLSDQKILPPTATIRSGRDESDIVVTARTIDAVDALVASLTRTDGSNQVARWDREICPKILGLNPAQTALVTENISKVAKIAGLRTAEGHCKGNVIVVVTSEASSFANALVQRHPALYRAASQGLTPKHERVALANSDAAVRLVVASKAATTGGAPSRLQQNGVEQLKISISIVDAKRLNGITWKQLSDYVALASLTRADMDVTYAPDTILSLFQPRTGGIKPPSGLTALDKAFLTSLYTSNPALDAKSQRIDIRTSIKRNLQTTAQSLP